VTLGGDATVLQDFAATTQAIDDEE